MKNRKRIQDLLDSFEESSQVEEIASNNTLEYHKNNTLIDGCFEQKVWAVYTGYSDPCIWGTADEVVEALGDEQRKNKIADEA